MEGSWTLFDGWRRPPRRSEILSAGVDLEAGLGINGFFPISVSEEDEWLLEPENFLSGLQKNNKIEVHISSTHQDGGIEAEPHWALSTRIRQT